MVTIILLVIAIIGLLISGINLYLLIRGMN